MRTWLVLVKRHGMLEPSEGFNLVLVLEPTVGPVYRREFALRVGEEESVEKVAEAIRHVSTQLERLARSPIDHPLVVDWLDSSIVEDLLPHPPWPSFA